MKASRFRVPASGVSRGKNALLSRKTGLPFF